MMVFLNVKKMKLNEFLNVDLIGISDYIDK